MTLVVDVRLDHIARYHFFKLGALVDMDLLLYAVVVLDVIVLTFCSHQCALDRIFRQTLFERRRSFFLTRRLSHDVP